MFANAASRIFLPLADIKPLYRTTLDAHVVALDMKTGKEVWKTKVAEWKEGYSITSAPTVANGVLMTGMTGGESTNTKS